MNQHGTCVVLVQVEASLGAILGSSWSRIGAILGNLGAILGRLEANLDFLEAI